MTYDGSGSSRSRRIASCPRALVSPYVVTIKVTILRFPTHGRGPPKTDALGTGTSLLGVLVAHMFQAARTATSILPRATRSSLKIRRLLHSTYGGLPCGELERRPAGSQVAHTGNGQRARSSQV
jgi:hypothetical protein